MRPSLPNSFFRLHIDKLGLEAEPVMNREEELTMAAKGVEEEEDETLRSASRSIKVRDCVSSKTGGFYIFYYNSQITPSLI
jgi:hypothetical protein